MAERIAFEVNEETRTVEVAPDTAAALRAAQRARAQQPAFRLWARAMRRMHRPCRRRSDAVVLAAGIGGGRDQGDDARRARHARTPAPATGGLHCRAGAAMRLLPEWLDHDGGGVIARQPPSLGAADPRRALRPQMPLRDAYGHLARRLARGAGGVKEGAMTQFSIDRRSLFKGAGALIVSIGIPGAVATAEIG